MIRYISVFIFASFILLSSCQIREEVTFNEDFSGSYSFVIDLKELMGQILTSKLATATDEGDDFNATAEFNRIVYQGGLETLAYLNTDSIELALGLKNMEVNMDTFTYSITVSFDFDDLSKLNAFYKHLNRSASVTSEISKEKSFIWNKESKVFSFTQTAETANEQMQGGGAPQGIFDKFEIYYQYTFPFKIKEVSDSLAVYENSKLQLTIPFNQAFKLGRKLEVRFEE